MAALARNTNDKILGGVASGIAGFLGVDVGLTRLITLAIVVLTGFGPVLYIAAWFLIPDQDGNSGLSWATNELRSRKDSSTS